MTVQMPPSIPILYETSLRLTLELGKAESGE